MAALGAIPADALAGYVVLGELSLDGTIAPVAGALPAAIGANAMGKGLICPAAAGRRRPGPARHRHSRAAQPDRLANHFRGTQVLPRPSRRSARAPPANLPDLADIKGQEAPSGRSRSRRPAATTC
jgi:magnesium chelatase family protein